jgi:hypothetical protein
MNRGSWWERLVRSAERATGATGRCSPPAPFAAPSRPTLVAAQATLLLAMLAGPARAEEELPAPPKNAPTASEEHPADEREVIALATSVQDADEALAADAATVDRLVIATLQDLGFAIDVGAHDPVADHAMAALARSADKLIVRPTLRRLDGHYELTMTAAHPGSSVLRVRSVKVSPAELQLKAVVILRDVATAEPPPAPAPSRDKAPAAAPSRGDGRAVLAVNGTVFGGFLGYSIQRSSGSDDPRLLYPLMAVGSGVGLGAAILASDEWNVGSGEAWFLTAGTWWPTAAAHLIHVGRFGDSTVPDEQWTFGLIGSVAGLTLSTALVLDHGMGDGGAVLAHSGGATGMVIGGLIDMGVSGIHDAFPLAGMGYGAAGGWLAASSLAVLWEPTAGDVFLVDLGLLLGGLAGASAASPLLFDEPEPDKTRGWVGATGGGLLLGGTLALIFLPDEDTTTQGASPAWWPLVPAPSVVGLPPTLGEVPAAGYGLRWHGAW